MVAIGNGTPLMAEDFVEQFDIPYNLYTDEDRHTYSLLKLHRGLGIGLGSVSAGLRNTRKGIRQGKNQGDIWQQGGEALINGKGEMLWVNRCKKVEQHSTPKEILAAINTHFPAR
jgi:hypothetical protein